MLITYLQNFYQNLTNVEIIVFEFTVATASTSNLNSKKGTKPKRSSYTYTLLK